MGKVGNEKRHTGDGYRKRRQLEKVGEEMGKQKKGMGKNYQWMRKG